MFDIGYSINSVITHEELCKKVKCGCSGGIRYSKKTNALVLFINSNSQYDNEWNGDILKYMGSGAGDQSFEKGGNMRVAESAKNDTALFLFEWVDSGNCKFIGRMELVKPPHYEKIKNKFGEDEKKVIFLLRRAK